jgi:histidine triad (HIT) family protein
MTLPPPERCLICDIVTGHEASSRVYEDGDVLAFMDLFPVNPGHVLVAPRAHAVGLTDLDLDLGVSVWRVAHRLARAVRDTTLRCEGVNLFLADGQAAFQEVFHVHLHVFPRFVGDSFTIDARWLKADRADLDVVAGHISDALSRHSR